MNTLLVVILFVIQIYALNDYGIYCGKDRSNTLGSQPLDKLDRNCQIHDICLKSTPPIMVKSDQVQCFCDEQLYEKLSIYQPLTTQQEQEQTSGLSTAYVSILGCDNYNYLTSRYYIANCLSHDQLHTESTTPCDSSKGYTYLPIYPKSQKTIIDINLAYNTKVYRVSNSTYYSHFVTTAYSTPQGVTAVLDNDLRYSQLEVPNTVLIEANGDIIIAVNYLFNDTSYIDYTEYPDEAVQDISDLQDEYSELDARTSQQLADKDKLLLSYAKSCNSTTLLLQQQNNQLSSNLSASQLTVQYLNLQNIGIIAQMASLQNTYDADHLNCQVQIQVLSDSNMALEVLVSDNNVIIDLLRGELTNTTALLNITQLELTILRDSIHSDIDEGTYRLLFYLLLAINLFVMCIIIADKARKCVVSRGYTSFTQLSSINGDNI